MTGKVALPASALAISRAAAIATVSSTTDCCRLMAMLPLRFPAE
jgi:hypothetical protein